MFEISLERLDRIETVVQQTNCKGGEGRNVSEKITYAKG